MDDILLQRIRNQDKTAFEVLYNQYANYALRVATAVTGKPLKNGTKKRNFFYQ